VSTYSEQDLCRALNYLLTFQMSVTILGGALRGSWACISHIPLCGLQYDIDVSIFFSHVLMTPFSFFNAICSLLMLLSSCWSVSTLLAVLCASMTVSCLLDLHFLFVDDFICRFLILERLLAQVALEIGAERRAVSRKLGLHPRSKSARFRIPPHSTNALSRLTSLLTPLSLL